MIEPTLYYETINRCAILVKAKKPFYDWINYVDPEFPVQDNDEGTVYLLKELESREKIENWLKRNFLKIFDNELNDYHTDENDWPQKRTYKVFNEWFTVEIASMIVDLEDRMIEKE
jgi:hypothetical protein